MNPESNVVIGSSEALALQKELKFPPIPGSDQDLVAQHLAKAHASTGPFSLVPLLRHLADLKAGIINPKDL